MKLVNSIKKFFGISSTEDDESKIINNEEVIINEKLKYQIIDIAPNTYLTCLGAKTCVNKPMSSNADSIKVKTLRYTIWINLSLQGRVLLYPKICCSVV